MSALPEATFAPTAAAGGRTRGFFSGAREIDDAAVRVEGTLPGWLRGVLLQGGPALWELPRGALQHWFDGYAMWHRWRFDGTAAVRYRSRFADSASYRGSRQAQRPVSGEFGSPNPHGLLARLRGAPPTDNPAVAISRHGERWIAVSETPYLTVFDPDTLATLARLDLRYDDAPMHLMAAHGFSLDDGSYLNVGVTIGRECRLRLFRLRPGAPRPDVLGEVRTARPGYLHGFALAPGHAVVWDCALRLQPIAMRFGAGSYAGNFRWEPGGGAALHAIPLDGGATRSWRIPPMMAFHATQAWCEGRDLVLDIAIYDDGTVFDDLLLARRRADEPMRAVPRHVRYRLRDGRAEAEPEPLGQVIELQQVHPAAIGRRRASVCWGAGGEAGGRLLDRTLRWDLDSGELRSWQRPDAMQLEPLFVPRPGASADDDGVLLVPTLAAADATTVLAVVDARSLQPRALLYAPQVLPFGFHAAFATG